VCKEIGPKSVNNPDPGAYNVPRAKSAKNYSVGKDTRFKEYKKNLPSPADYNIPSRI